MKNRTIPVSAKARQRRANTYRLKCSKVHIHLQKLIVEDHPFNVHIV